MQGGSAGPEILQTDEFPGDARTAGLETTL